MPDRPHAAVDAKLAKSNEFLLMAEMSLEMDSYDAAASLAVSAVINAADALVLHRTGALMAADDHRQAVTVVRKLGFPTISQHMSRVLGLKNKAQYQIQRCTAQEARDAVTRAGRLITSVKEAL